MRRTPSNCHILWLKFFSFLGAISRQFDESCLKQNSQTDGRRCELLQKYTTDAKREDLKEDIYEGADSTVVAQGFWLKAKRDWRSWTVGLDFQQ
jgi:hypothetical protein